MKNYTPLLIVILLVYSCVSDYEGDYPLSDPIPILNGVLCADSIFKFSLQWSDDVTGTNYTNIENSTIVVYKNEEILNTDYSIVDDYYYYDDTCHVQDNYSIKITIEGYGAISAETTIPDRSIVSCVSSDTIGSYYEYELSVDSFLADTGAIYFIGVSYEEDDTTFLDGETISLICNSPYADESFRSIDMDYPSGYTYDYSPLRFLLSEINNLQCNFLISKSYASIYRLAIINVSESYDNYYKSCWVQLNQDPTGLGILSYENIYVSSNVENGTGIFAGISTTWLNIICP